MNKPVFYDPQRKRWKRLRRIFDALALFGLVIGTLFIVGLLRMKPLPELLLATQTRNYRAITNRPKPVLKPGQKVPISAHRKSATNPSDLTLNAGEGLRAAYYVDWDSASYASLKEHIKQIDLLFPEWLHVTDVAGTITANNIDDNRMYTVVDKSGSVRGVDQENKVARAIADNHVDTEVFPLVNNYDVLGNRFSTTVGPFLASDQSRQNFIAQMDKFLAANPNYRGLTVDFEQIPAEAQDGFKALIGSLYADLQARHLRLYVNVPVDDPDFDLGFLSDHSDGLVLMNYDEHQSPEEPGPVASQDWFLDNLQKALKVVPKDKLMIALGSYGYDWTSTLPATPPPAPKKGKPAVAPPLENPNVIAIGAQDAWQAASDADATIELDPDSLNAHFSYDDEDAHLRHEVWYLDAVTVLNEMRAARTLGIQTFSLWRLGSEDGSLWKIWDNPTKIDPAKALAAVPPGYNVDTEGSGDILRIVKRPTTGARTLTLDDDDQVPVPVKMVTKEVMQAYPSSYTVEQYGYQPRKVSLSFDDGPDPEWTPKILDILKQYNVKGTFLMIGEVAEDNVGVMQRVYREGHEIGNHTFTHPDISEISTAQVDLQLNLTERLFGSKLGVQPLYFRPPYSIDQEPDTNDQAAPVDHIQSRGYVTIGNKVDTNDWDEHPRKTPQEIADSVLEQLAAMPAHPDRAGSIILMHDGGGDRSVTIASLPLLITTLRAHGFEFVPVSELIGKTRDEVMPPLNAAQKRQAWADSITFFFLAFFNHLVFWIFYVGDVLMSARLIIIGVFAVVDRFRKRKNFASPDYLPRVAVLIPAYNEEKVIARTIRSVMMSNYKNLRIVVIDDGSKDKTYRGRAECVSGADCLGAADGD